MEKIILRTVVITVRLFMVVVLFGVLFMALAPSDLYMYVAGWLYGNYFGAIYMGVITPGSWPPPFPWLVFWLETIGTRM